jgi:RNA polymerase sigma-70 factor (ECF subfamily)
MRGVLIDQGVVERASKGDKEAFSLLVCSTGTRALIVAERILRSPEDAISAVSKVFVIAYSNLKKLKNLGLVELWLMQNLVRVCGDSIKDATKNGGVTDLECKFPESLAASASLASADVPAVSEAAGPDWEADLRTRKEARREAVRNAVDRLPFLERTAIIFRDWDGISYLEVAEILRSKPDEVRKLLVRGRSGAAAMLMSQQSAAEPGTAGSSEPAGDRCNVSARAGNPTSERRGMAGRWGLKLARKRQTECGKSMERLWLFVGGEMGQAEETELLHHVTQCAACWNYLKGTSIMLETIRDAAPLVEKPLIAPEMLWKEVEPLLLE